MAVDEKYIWMVYYCFCYGYITVVEKKLDKRTHYPSDGSNPIEAQRSFYSYDLAIININSGYLFSMYLSAFHQVLVKETYLYFITHQPPSFLFPKAVLSPPRIIFIELLSKLRNLFYICNALLESAFLGTF